MQKYIKLEGFVKSNNEAVEAVVQHLVEKYKIEKETIKKYVDGVTVNPEEKYYYHNEYVIPFSEILTKAYAKMLATLFLTTDGSMKRWAVNVSSEKRKLHKKTYSIQ